MVSYHSLSRQCRILARYLADGRWHSTSELYRRFADEYYGAMWSGLRTRASNLHQMGLLESRKGKNNIAWYRLYIDRIDGLPGRMELPDRQRAMQTRKHTKPEQLTLCV